jgi:hypothetical protein
MKFKGEEFETLEGLQERVEELLSLIDSELMERVCEHWIERLNKLRDTNDAGLIFMQRGSL